MVFIGIILRITAVGISQKVTGLRGDLVQHWLSRLQNGRTTS
jgi:hypothetical protein